MRPAPRQASSSLLWLPRTMPRRCRNWPRSSSPRQDPRKRSPWPAPDHTAKKAPASERADAYRQKAQIQRKLDDEAGAAASLKLALDREPGNARTLEELSSLGLAAQRQKAQAQRARDDKVGGQVSLKLAGGRPQEALALLDGHPPSDARLQAPWLVLRGLARMMLKERAVALEDLGAAIRLDPMAACFDKLLLNNRHRLAAPYFDLCVERFPKDPALRLDRGVARYLSGQTDGALEDFRKAVELSPTILKRI